MALRNTGLRQQPHGTIDTIDNEVRSVQSHEEIDGAPESRYCCSSKSLWVLNALQAICNPALQQPGQA
ncbi:hypothetical protein ASPBRDRAFT_49701 [Aspergillus brasiliensis CBS 101740]|uniref:Uncharacterized protein n=1 Tax=Aspergillus brasiliensis (strain CBS 101740 / IMI 381727 / IBT 21946) TaxID=767769 RepID=A0A1L9U1W7_ASPBC|nr:hypothetical protein ASPBRDRAFT_49701 [Aspergillus brasiliensis CBS 101740]